MRSEGARWPFVQLRVHFGMFRQPSDSADSELGLYFVPLVLCVVVLGDATEV